MCGRFVSARKRLELLEEFAVERDLVAQDRNPDYNVAPTKRIYTVMDRAEEGDKGDGKPSGDKVQRELRLVRWGLVPSWAKSASGGARMINARAETVAEKPAFREALERRRCLLPADGFFEWKKLGKGTQPYCIQLTDDSVFAFAGIWDRWRNPDKEWIETCSILTTTPNAVTADVHDRMPVILRRDDYDLWLDPGFTKVEGLSDLLKPLDARLMKKYPVCARISDVRNDDEQSAAPAEIAESESQGSLFG